MKQSNIVNSISNLGIRIYQIILAFALTPIVIQNYGDEVFGIWSLFLVILGLKGLITFGIEISIIRNYSIIITRDDKNKSNEFVSSCINALAGWLILICFFAYIFHSKIFNFFTVPENLLSQVTDAFPLLLVSLFFECIALVPSGWMKANQNYLKINKIITLSISLKFILILIFIKFFDASLIYIVVAHLLKSFFECIFYYVIMIRKVGFKSLSIKNASVKVVWSLLTFGFGSMLLYATNILRFDIDYYFISKYVGIKELGYYKIGGIYLASVFSIITYLFAASLPVFSQSEGEKDDNAIKSLLTRSYFISSYVSCLFIPGTLLLIGPFLTVWLKDYSDISMNLILILILPQILAMINYPLINLFYSKGMQIILSKFILIESLINVIISYIYVQKIGIYGVAIGTAISLVISKTLFNWILLKKININMWNLIYVSLPGVITGFSVLFVGSYIKKIIDLSPLWLFITLGLVITVLYSLLFYLISKLMCQNILSTFTNKLNFQKALLKKLKINKDTMFYVGGYPDIPNLGDVALYDSYQAMFPNKKIIHFAGGRFEKQLFKNNYKLPSVLAGGTLINRLGLNTVKDAREMGLKFVVLGTGVAQENYWSTTKNWVSQLDKWKELLQELPYIGVRGPLSQNQLQEIGIDCEVFGDPVLYLANDSFDKYKKTNKKIGLNIGSSLGQMWGGEELLKSNFVKIVNQLKENGWEVFWYVVCPDDLEITLNVAKETGTYANIFKVYKRYEEFYDLTSNLDLFVGVKLHAVVLALCNYVPSIMIEYRPKCLDFMQSLGLEEFNIRANELNVDLIEDKIKLILNDKNLRNSIYSKINRIKHQQKMTIEKLFSNSK